MLSNPNKDYIKLVETNPIINDLANNFGLTLPNGRSLPDVVGVNEIRFSLFWKEGDNTKNITPLKVISFDKLVEIIKSDWNKQRVKIERPYITPYGTFSQRNNDSLNHFNRNLICLDYDKLDKSELNYLKLFWKGQRNTVLSLVSPSKNGLKVIIRAKHTFEPNDLYNGLKHNVDFFVVGGVKPDLAQFVLSQPMFIPYAENPYYNPGATLKDYNFKPLPIIEIVESKPIVLVDDSKMDRVNKFFKNRVEIYISNFENSPIEKGTHQQVYSVIKRIYPYINQQTVYTEAEITQRLESIVIKRYGHTREVKSLHRSIEIGRYPELNLVELINKDAIYKIKV